MTKKPNYIRKKLLVISNGIRAFYEIIKNIVLKTPIDGVLYQPTADDLPDRKIKKKK